MKLLVEVIAPLLAFLLLLYFLYRTFLGPSLSYRVQGEVDLGDPDAVRGLAAVMGGSIHHQNRLKVLNQGAEFYLAELQAIQDARSQADSRKIGPQTLP